MAFDPDYLLDLPPRVYTRRYTFRGTILYALGADTGQDPDDDDLCFVYEEGLKIGAAAGSLAGREEA